MVLEKNRFILEEVKRKTVSKNVMIYVWEVKVVMLQTFDRHTVLYFLWSKIYVILLLTSVLLLVSLGDYLKVGGVIIRIIFLECYVFYKSNRKTKKQYNIQICKEITAFINGEKLDVIQKNREIGKIKKLCVK